MYIAVIIILIYISVRILKEKIRPKNPPIDDIQEHCKTIMQLPNQKARQQYLKSLSKQNVNRSAIKNMQSLSKEKVTSADVSLYTEGEPPEKTDSAN